MPALSELSLGSTATIRDITGDDAIAIRLMEMGLTEGESIAFIGAAPLGDPLEYSIRGYRLSLRKSEAARVVVDDVHSNA